MADGIELILGYTWKMLKDIPQFEGRTIEDLDDNPFEYREELRRAHRKACADMGFKFLKTDKENYDIYETPLGKRTMKPFVLECHYDPSNEETEEEAIIGISVSHRYFPIFVDWKDDNGSIYMAVFDEETNNILEIAINRILEELPWMSKAVWIVKQKHY